MSENPAAKANCVGSRRPEDQHNDISRGARQGRSRRRPELTSSSPRSFPARSSRRRSSAIRRLSGSSSVKAERFFEEVSLLIGDVVANGRSFDKQAGTAAVAGILGTKFCADQTMDSRVRSVLPFWFCIKSDARENPASANLSRGTPGDFSSSPRSRSASSTCFGRWRSCLRPRGSCELEFGLEGVGIAQDS